MKGRRLHGSILAVLLPAIAQLSYRGGLFDSASSTMQVKEPTPNHVHKEVTELRHNVSSRTHDIVSSVHVSQEEIKKALYHNNSGENEIEKKSLHHNASSTATGTRLDEFQVNDLDWRARASCGWEKCYFRSKSDYRHVGYLLAPRTKKSKERLKALEGAWKLAEELKQKHNITHFLLAPPSKLTVTKQLESQLNKNLWSERYQRTFPKRYKRYRKGQTVVVQKVKPAPKQRLLLGCKKSKLGVFDKRLDKFVGSIEDDKEFFVQNFKKGFAQTRELLHKEPCMALDFQVFLDASGNIYHLDFDRCFNTRKGKKKRRDFNPQDLDKTDCYKTLEKIERRIYRALKK